MTGGGNAPHHPRILFLLSAGLAIALTPAVLIEMRDPAFSLSSFLSWPLLGILLAAGAPLLLGGVFALFESSRIGIAILGAGMIGVSGWLLFSLVHSPVAAGVLFLIPALLISLFTYKYWNLAGPNPEPDKFYRPIHVKEHRKLKTSKLFTYEPLFKKGKEGE